MPGVTAIRHLCFEDLGSLAAATEERGLALRYLDAGIDDLAALDPLEPALLVILGGPIGVNDGDDYPFLADELALLQRRLAADLPTLGICLGAQLIARALGSAVYPGPAREIGWQPLELTAAGRSGPMRHLDGALTSMLHWHGDTFDLPPGATLLASTPPCRHQAFAWGRSTLALQCHPEALAAQMERWFIGHTGEIAAAGLSVGTLRRDTALHGRTLESQARLFFAEWLDSSGL
jgi:GMP synthase (glutamine-hydrolysing)